MLGKKGEPMEYPTIRGVSLVGQIQWEQEKARRAALKNPAPVTKAATPGQPAPAAAAPLPAEAERQRVLNILSAAEAEGRAVLAMHLAAETDIHSMEALAIMRLAPKWQLATEAEPVERILTGMSLEERVEDALQSRAGNKEKAGQAAREAADAVEIERMLATMKQREGGA